MKGEGIWRAALYLRLSRDDEAERESASIANQRKLLREYAAQNGYQVAAEYVDDGWSGTNFERPAFQCMMRDIDSGRIDLVLVKDLSRLGRDYIQTGRYLEVVFPQKGVRLIAVNDGLDTAHDNADIAPFRNVVNELYARDTSRKIRSTLQAKMRAGQYIGNFAPYGYRKDPADKNHLLPDEPAASVVRRIFAWAAERRPTVEIARRLNEEGVLPPALYRCQKYPALDPANYTKRGEWTEAGVGRILKNIVYLGHIAQGKTSKVSFKCDKILIKPSEDWTVVRDCHEALVTQEQYEAAQQKSRHRTGKSGFHNLFSGLVYCADCGEPMATVGTRKQGSAANFACSTYKKRGKDACSNHFIAYETLYDCVLQALRRYAALTQEEQELLCRRLERSNGAAASPCRAALIQKQEHIRDIISSLYADRAEGRLREQDFYGLLERHERRARELEAQIETYAEEQADSGDVRGRIAVYAEVQTLTVALVLALIRRIEISQGQYISTGRAREKTQEVKIWLNFTREPATYLLEGR